MKALSKRINGVGSIEFQESSPAVYRQSKQLLQKMEAAKGEVVKLHRTALDLDRLYLP